jgi:hypothetical protein
MTRVYLIGYPGNMGGANTEAWHTLKLWRRMGYEVRLIPTWGCDSSMEARCSEIGCQTLHVAKEAVAGLEELRGQIAVGMCNSHYMSVFGELKAMGVKTVWVNCMTFIFSHEHQGFQQHGPADAYVFQSEFQRGELEPFLSPLKYRKEQGHTIHGAFDVSEYPFSPRAHPPGQEFCIGRLSRPDLDKWSSNHWPILGMVPYSAKKALAMGWNVELERKLGRPPEWAEALEPQKIPVAEFLGRCHAMIGLNGGARENWPRVGLEAMSAGVPLVCQNNWGWKEMIRHGETGFLANDDADLCYYLALLAHDDEVRMRICRNARRAVEALADPDYLGGQWRQLFDNLTSQESGTE